MRHEVGVVIEGQGAITASEVGLSCPGTCSAQVAPNTPIELVAAPAAGWEFSGWSGACAGNTTTRCSLTITQDTTATARFVQFAELRIVLTGTGNGIVTSSPGDIRCGAGGPCTQRFLRGTPVTLTAAASGNAVFRGWRGGCSGTTTPCGVTMDRDIEVIARFERPHRLVAIDEITLDLVTINPDLQTTTRIGPINVPYGFGDCAWNPADSTLYMIDGRGNQGLYRINLATGAASLVGTHGIANLEALAFHPPTSRFFSASILPQELFSMNPATGVPTSIGAIGENFQGMAWDVARDRMVMFDGMAMFSVNVSSGAMTQLATTGPRIVNFGMTYSPDIDRFWVVDRAGRLVRFDPNQQFARTDLGPLPSGYTCVAAIPVP